MPSDLALRRFFSITLLAVVVSGLSLAAVVRALSLTRTQQIEHARAAVTNELERLPRRPSSLNALAELPGTTYVGLRGGWLDTPARVAHLHDLPASWRVPLERAAAAGRCAVTETEIGSGTKMEEYGIGVSGGRDDLSD